MRPPNERGRGLTSPDPQDGHPAACSQDSSGVGQATLDAYIAELASRARDTGLATAERNDAEWANRVFAWIAGLEHGVEVTADDARREWGTSPAMGSVFRRASQAGLISPVGLTESTAVSRHKGLQRVWRRV
jgi:hypothetical protein